MLKATEAAVAAIAAYWNQVTVTGVPRDDALVKIDAGLLRKLAEAHTLEAIVAGAPVAPPESAKAPKKPAVPQGERPQPISRFVASHCTGHLEQMTKAEITKILGFKPNGEGDILYGVAEWVFTYKGHDMAIWDYEGSSKFGQFSTYGPKELYDELFGNRFIDESH